jgi:hypothetical protein
VSRPSSSTGRFGNAARSVRANTPLPERCGMPPPYTFTRSMPQLGEFFLST